MERRDNGLHLHQSNDFDWLVGRLLDDLAATPADPFQPQAIIIPSASVRRAVEDRYARRFGIAVNLEFDFLARWVWNRIGETLPATRATPLATTQLVWHVYQALGLPEFRANQPRLAHYLARAETDPVMRYELASRITRVLHRCLPWRPEWIARWSRGELSGLPDFVDEAWLSALWRWLARQLALPQAHPVHAFLTELENMTPEARARCLPPRLSVFCPAELPPLYLDVLRQLARFMSIELYLFNPCREYWSLIVTAARLARHQVRDEALYHEIGHPLLAAWGQETRGVVAGLEHLDELQVADEHFAVRETPSLLAWLQNDILQLREKEGVVGDLAGAQHLPPALQTGDGSVEIHVCHGFTRQLEVLHDRLLARFEADSELSTADVLVVLPDLETRAPLIDAVFGGVPRARMMPYQIVGLQGRSANPAVEALLALFDLLRARCRASAVFTLLRHPLVRRRLALDEDALDRVHGWMHQSDMRWGLDAADRMRSGQPEDDFCTLREGLDRLFLGLALPDTQEPWQGLLPVSAVEGAETRALGVLWQFIQQLGEARSFVTEARHPAAWGEFCTTWVARLLPDDREALDALRPLRAVLHQCFDDLEATSLQDALPFAVVLEHLREAFEDSGAAAMAGPRLTFAPIHAVRFLPFRIICVLGLEEELFPRRGLSEEFDPLGAAPRPGDPNPRLTDRNVFLDLLLSARDQFYVSYTGRSARDDSELPPSIVVSDLLDYLATCWSPNGDVSAVRAALEFRHPLQAFSPRYFGADTRLTSYATEYAEALAKPRTRGREDARFCRESLPEPSPPLRHLTLHQLASFLRNPSQHFLRQRLGIRLDYPNPELSDLEPDSAGKKAQRSLARRLLPALRGGADQAHLWALARAGREFPPGPFGELRMTQVISALGQLCARHALYLAGDSVGTRHLQYTWQTVNGPFTLEGVVDEITPTGRLVMLPKPLYDDKRLEMWVFHLALQLCLDAEGKAGLPTRVLFLDRYLPDDDEGKKKSDKSPEGQQTTRGKSGKGKPAKSKSMVHEIVFAPVPPPDAAEILFNLITRYREALCSPLRFFPGSAYAFAQKLLPDPRKRTRKQDDEAARLVTARRDAWGIWAPTYTDRRAPEQDDAWHALTYRGVDPLDDAFEALAREIWLPPLRALHEGLDDVGEGDT